MLDDIAEAVLARDEVVKYLRSGYGGESGAQARERIHGYLDELRTTQRYRMYRALQHPLYPILRKVERIGEQLQHVAGAERDSRIVYVSNHKSHIDYLVSRSCSTPPASGHRSSPPASTCSADRSD